ncbi:MAG: M24 family metallopeptidase [Parvularculaceae bacterium]
MFVQAENFSENALARFRDLQRLSFSILEERAAKLHEGETEKEVARDLVKQYRAAGFTSFFHLPVVLFGSRTALPGDWKIGNFYPKKKKLGEGDSVIMDAAPISSGFLVDTSYSFCLGENVAHREMMGALSEFRDSICKAVNAGKSFKAIAEDVEARFGELGYEPAHGKHPGAVLGHRTVKLPATPFNWRINGFDGLALSWFLAKDGFAKGSIGRRSPLWNSSPASNHAPHKGLWLVEPHAGAGEIGAKWEEILIIDKEGARWLDSEPPHVRQWRNIKSGKSYLPLQ